MEQWFFKIKNDIRGPFRLDELMELAAKGVITRNTLIRIGTGAGWFEARRKTSLKFPPKSQLPDAHQGNNIPEPAREDDTYRLLSVPPCIPNAQKDRDNPAGQKRINLIRRQSASGMKLSSVPTTEKPASATNRRSVNETNVVRHAEWRFLVEEVVRPYVYIILVSSGVICVVYCAIEVSSKASKANQLSKRFASVKSECEAAISQCREIQTPVVAPERPLVVWDLHSNEALETRDDLMSYDRYFTHSNDDKMTIVFVDKTRTNLVGEWVNYGRRRRPYNAYRQEIELLLIDYPEMTPKGRVALSGDMPTTNILGGGQEVGDYKRVVWEWVRTNGRGSF